MTRKPKPSQLVGFWTGFVAASKEFFLTGSQTRVLNVSLYLMFLRHSSAVVR
jgi:hypothetical protein